MDISLKEKYKDYFDIGAAINPMTAKNDAEVIKKHFSSITCENEMKYGVIRKKDGIYHFEDADLLYIFARDNGLKMRGHNFVWHNQTALNIFDKDEQYTIDELSKHIRIMNDRYGDIITCWDVVNEAIEDKTSEYLRISPWLDKLGDDYIRRIFEIASAILPEGVGLFYNDYNEYVPEKLEKIVKMIKSVNADKKLITGMGLQCHVNLYYPTIDLMRKAIETYASLGLRLHITEMDLSFYEFEDKSKMDEPTPELVEKHAKLYGEYFALFREYKDHIDNVTLWGVTDSYSWLTYFPVRDRKNWPMLFDADGKEKEAFYRVVDF
jgi:endo-1,4-beta-xylanase